MILDNVELTGGESVYCINEKQLRKAFELVERESESAGRVRSVLSTIENDLDRNERAALAFVLIHRLLSPS